MLAGKRTSSPGAVTPDRIKTPATALPAYYERQTDMLATELHIAAEEVSAVSPQSDRNKLAETVTRQSRPTGHKADSTAPRPNSTRLKVSAEAGVHINSQLDSLSSYSPEPSMAPEPAIDFAPAGEPEFEASDTTTAIMPNVFEPVLPPYEARLDIPPAGAELLQTEADFIGELLLGSVVAIEAEALSEPGDYLEALSCPEAVFVPAQTAAENNDDIRPGGRDFETQLAYCLELVEPSQREAALPVIDSLSAAIQEIRQLPDDVASAEQVLAEQELERLCGQLFECLAIAYDEALVQRFLQSVYEGQPEAEHTAAERTMSIQELNALGVYEYKTDGSDSLFKALVGLLQQKLLPHLLLGRYALQFIN